MYEHTYNINTCGTRCQGWYSCCLTHKHWNTRAVHGCPTGNQCRITLFPARWVINHRWTPASLTNQPNITGESVSILAHTHLNTHTDTYACMHTKECVQTRIHLYPHAFYQSNLIRKSMIWLENRELMQSMGLSSFLSQSLLICLSHVLPPFPFSLSPFLSCFFLWKTTKQHLHTVCRQAVETHPAWLMVSATILGIFLNFYWWIFRDKKCAFSFTTRRNTWTHIQADIH